MSPDRHRWPLQLTLPQGEATHRVSYIGYEATEKKVVLTGAAMTVECKLESLVLGEAVVAADLAIDRKTPVAFTNVLPAQIQEELAGRDLPLILNSTPGVYATQQGGGDGDARVTIRGFDQTNLAVMVDGVPMNDMENGWVYWSNWAGLGPGGAHHSGAARTWCQQAGHSLCRRHHQHSDGWR